MTLPDPRFDASPLDARLEVVDALARLQLEVRRGGGQVALCDLPRELDGLLVLCGLRGVVGGEPLGEPEEREQPWGVEEGLQGGDPPV